MANILYVDESYRSSELIECLDENDVEYELHGEYEAKKMGYKNLPVLVVDGKAMDFKKAKRYARSE